MSAYLTKGKGWRYDFTLNGIRHTQCGFKTKAEAKRAEAKRKEELKNPVAQSQTPTPTGMGFLELVNKRLDHVRSWKSERYYSDHKYISRRWVKRWGKLKCSDMTADMIQRFMMERRKVSAYTANNDLRFLRATFNYGKKFKWVDNDPTSGIEFMPVEKKLKYVPPKEDILKVLMAADGGTRDYLYTILETMGRMSEVNKLLWSDVDLEKRYVVLYTRKKKGGSRTPRKVAMTNKLFDVLSRMFKARDKEKPWVFWGRHWDKKQKCWVEGPYKERTRIMRSLCKKAKVKYFRYHALRHFGASMLDSCNVGIGFIQRRLGHENRTTTEIYLHSIEQADREAMQVFERAMESLTLSLTPKKEEASAGALTS